MMRSLIFLVIYITAILANAQNTVGLISFIKQKTQAGYNLIYPFGQSSVFLLNACGEIVHEWKDAPNTTPGTAVHLLENGNLLKCKNIGSNVNDTIKAGGAGEVVELRNWDNELLWSFTLNNGKARLHHDAEVLPNGNILLLAWELFTPEQAISQGRRPSLIIEGAIWPDFLLEINPLTNEIVWEWHAWQHLIQDFDSTKFNFGVVADHEELIDVNQISASGQADWMHSNAIDYNADLDLIALSVAHFNEIWFIDHSTTKDESSAHIGGKFKKGGDLVYRWGNPKAYKRGQANEEKLFFQHDIHWLVNDKKDYHAKHSLAVFNNRVSTTVSNALLFTPQFDTNTFTFLKDEKGRYLPEQADKEIFHPIQPSKLSSSGLSSVQLLNNNNFLLFSGNQGYAIEIDDNNTIVWEYIIPLKNGKPINQGELASSNASFRMKRYDVDYAAFEGKDLSPKSYLELNPNIEFCDLIESTDETSAITIKIFPNPTSSILNVLADHSQQLSFELYDLLGRKLKDGLFQNSCEINLQAFKTGIYILKIGDYKMKIFKQ